MTKRLKPAKSPTHAYAKLWRLVDGAVRDCFDAHPEYIPAGGDERTIRNSLVKRITGLTLGYAVEAARGRSVEKTAAENAGLQLHNSAHAGFVCPHGGEGRTTPPLNRERRR